MASQTIVMITGANTGIGLEAVKALLASPKPYHILLGSRSVEKAREAISALEIPGSSTVTSVQIDITDDSSIDRAVKSVSETAGHIDVLINNAGATFDGEIAAGRMTMREAWTKTYDLNVSGSQVVTHQFMPLLLKSADPRLLFITSGLSSLTGAASGFSNALIQPPPAGWPKPPSFSPASYRSSKTAMNMMMLEWTRVLKADGVKIWCISPGFLATGLGGNREGLVQAGAGDPATGGKFICDVVEGKRDEDAGKVIGTEKVQPW